MHKVDTYKLNGALYKWTQISKPKSDNYQPNETNNTNKFLIAPNIFIKKVTIRTRMSSNFLSSRLQSTTLVIMPWVLIQIQTKVNDSWHYIERITSLWLRKERWIWKLINSPRIHVTNYWQKNHIYFHPEF